MIFYALIKALIYVWFYKLVFFFILISAHKPSHYNKTKNKTREEYGQNAK